MPQRSFQFSEGLALHGAISKSEIFRSLPFAISISGQSSSFSVRTQHTKLTLCQLQVIKLIIEQLCRLIGINTIFTVSINLIVVSQTVYCPNLGIKICKRLTYKERSRLLLPQYRHFYPCNICSHCWGVHVDRVVDVTDVGSKHPPDKKSDPVKRTIFFVYFENLYTGNKLLQKCLQSDYYERWKAEWKSIYQIPLILSAFLNVQYASFITQQPYFRVPIQEPPGCGSSNNWM